MIWPLHLGENLSPPYHWHLHQGSSRETRTQRNFQLLVVLLMICFGDWWISFLIFSFARLRKGVCWLGFLSPLVSGNMFVAACGFVLLILTYRDYNLTDILTRIFAFVKVRGVATCLGLFLSFVGFANEVWEVFLKWIFSR